LFDIRHIAVLNCILRVCPKLINMDVVPSPKQIARPESHISERHQTIKLNIEDAEAFVDALLNPPKPNNALKEAALRYQQIMSV
jgi:hypothetical protein